MNRKITIIILSIAFGYFAKAQSSINDYKYIIIPKTFEFSKGEDEYKLNSLTKFLFNKYGYEAYFLDENLPEELAINRCLALTARVSNDKRGLFKTKLQINLLDCNGAIIMSSKTGESRLKKYGKAYNEALRNAFKTFQNIDYKYIPKTKQQKEDIRVVMIPNEQEKETQKLEIPKVEISKAKITKTKEATNVLTAKPISNGFQLIDSNANRVMTILKTASETIYVVEGKDAIIFKENNQWIYSENKRYSISREVLKIQFM